MKLVGNYFSKSAVYGVALVITSLMVSVQAQSKPGTAVVRAIVGSANYSVDGKPFQKLTVNRVLKAGAVIQTAAMSHVDLFLKQNGPVVRVTADTMLGLDLLVFEETGTDTVIETRLDLRNGRIQGNVKKLAAASKYEVKIPTGTVGIRGTLYDISATGVASCMQGSFVVLMPTQTQPFTVNAGQTFMPATTPGGAPTIVPSPTTGPNAPVLPPVVLPPGPEALPIVVVPPSIPPVQYVFGQVTLISSNVFNNFVFPAATIVLTTNNVGVVMTNTIPGITNVTWTDPVTHLVITNYFTNWAMVTVTNSTLEVKVTNVVDQINPGQTTSPVIH